MTFANISMVTLGVADLAAATAFYQKLGWKLSKGSSENVTFLDGGHIVLGLYGREALAKDAGVAAAGKGFTGVALAFNQPSEEAVDARLAEAKAAGADIVKPAEKVFWGGYSGYFADLDGHLWEVARNPFVGLDDKGRMMMEPLEAGDIS
jgi:catechol 2,3-dioxygenase-like lactoylglutathione lyase family enzyme